MSSVFLSHSSRDKPFVRELATKLAQHGVLVWVDEAELDIGDSLIEKISQGIYECNYVAAIISRSSVQSQWVQKELQLAMTREIEGRKIRVLPILIEQCKDQIPFFLRDKLYADFTKENSYEAQFSRLLRAIDRGLRNAGSEDASVPLGEVSIGSVLHDRGDDLLGFRLVRRKYRSGLQSFAIGMLLFFLCVMGFGRVPTTPIIFVLLVAFGICLYALFTILSATYLRQSYELDRNLLLELEQIGEAWVAFSGKWFRQLDSGRGNAKYRSGKYFEALAHFSGIGALVIGVLGIVYLIAHML